MASVTARRTLELALDYRCNLRCLGCHACDGSGDRLAPGRAAALLREGFQAGARAAWIGGGEPTLRDDLLPLVRRARELGYEQVVVQTNGVRLSYPAYARALVEAGVTDVRVNAKSARAEVHDALSAVPGTHALLVQGLENLANLATLATPGVRIAADVLLTCATAPHLDETVAFFADRGVTRFALWLLHAGDTEGGEAEVAREVPRIADLVPALERAAKVAQDRGVELVSFHTPPCTLPADLRRLWLPARDLGMTVVDPGGHAFALETSSFEGSGHVEACVGCAAGGRCGGPRADYLRLHGASEIRALGSV
jgi:MoaA/NifB/PqqE/SkfB family radical SAM enzyme